MPPSTTARSVCLRSVLSLRPTPGTRSRRPSRTIGSASLSLFGLAAPLTILGWECVRIVTLHNRLRAGSVKRTQSIEIARSPDEVFAFLTDPSKLTSWQDAEEVVQLTPGPLGVGSRLREVHKVLGRRRVEITEFVVYEPGQQFEIRMVDGPPLDGRWDLEPSPVGTRLTFTPIVRLTGLRKRVEPLMVGATLVVFRRFHRRLKHALEAG